MSRRIGRWVCNSESTRYGEAGWHLDNGPVVIDFMPGVPAACHHRPPHRGEYQLHNWPQDLPFAGSESPVLDHHSVACSLRDAMRVAEEEWDEVTR